MKKIIVLLTALLVIGDNMHAQAKQRKELLLQIAALQVYMDYAKKGYGVVSKGLNFIGDVKKGEVNLHSDYFASLLKVNPKIRNYYKTAEIISLQLKIMKTCRKTCDSIKAGELFHGDELDYVQRSFQRLLANCSATLDQLITLTTDSKLELRDDQRLERIDTLYQTMLEDYNFCVSFSREAEILSLSKARSRKDVQAVGEFYDL